MCRHKIMSRNLVILLVVMSAAVAGLIVFSKMRTRTGDHVTGTAPTTDTTPSPVATQTPDVVQPSIVRPSVAVPTNVQIPVVKPIIPQIQTGSVATTTTIPVPAITNDAATLPDTKPLPVLEKEYVATTNRDTRLDLMMDIADAPGPEAVKALARLFVVETDPDLKVDLLDSLLGIEGQVEEKLKMLTLGTEKGLPTDVRQSAIDGLIDLDDQRVIPVLNGLLNDPDEEIREGAKDALEMLQSKPAVKLK
jgi:hypothetical protein